MLFVTHPLFATHMQTCATTNDVLAVSKFPKKAIFAPRLAIKAYDTRLGGLSKPNIGNCVVPLEEKIPWDDSFKAGRTAAFSKPVTAEEVCRLLVDEDIGDLATLRLASRADLVEIGLTGPCSDAVLSSPHLHLH